MAERKLNINAPLMSVRRSSSKSPCLTEAKRKIVEKRLALPYYKSDSSSDQVTEPVAVPFNWEHIPGRRKGNGAASEPWPPKEASKAIVPSPRLPPGKYLNTTKQPPEKEAKDINKLKSSNKSQSFNLSLVKVDCDKEKKDEKRISNVNVDNLAAAAAADNDDDHDVFSDALDKLSHAESISMNCSVSGVSGLDNAKNSGTFSTDAQTRDFMMSRFLPAAKAMTLQTPQYASRRQSAKIEKPREVTKLVQEEKKPLLLKHVADILPDFGQGNEEEESEDEGGEYGNAADILAKGCGLFPQLHTRNSLCLLNQVSGVKMRNQLPTASTNDVGKSATDVGKSSKGTHIRSFSPVPAVKKAWDAIYKKKLSTGATLPDTQEVRKKWVSESSRFAYSGELQPPSRSSISPFRRARAAAGVSPCRSRVQQSSVSGAKLLGDSKAAENNHSGKLKFLTRGQGYIQEVPSQEAKKSSNSISSTVEKTLYIDTASTVKSFRSNSSFVGALRRIDSKVKELDKSKEIENNPARESSQDSKQMESSENKNILPSEVLGSVDASSSILSNMLNLKVQEDKADGLGTDREISNRLLSSQNVNGTAEEDSDINNKQIVIFDASVNSGAGSDPSSLAPPLPKSPSESWLWQALPLVSLRNSFSRSNRGTQALAKRQESDTTSGNAKWETIVKTSKLNHDHIRYSQELTGQVSQHSKS